ncbi:MAG: segregation/condensation protein A [Syntrophomonadaceae bacterium]
MSYLVNLDKFYGPLDLLLYLLEREEIDIYDIPIARIADQYMAYIDKTGNVDLDNIGDFLSMASYLLNLKSKMLLPVFIDEGGLDEVEDPREELVNRILAYKQYKILGECLADRYDDDSRRLFFRNGHPGAVDAEISTSIKALLSAWQSLLNRTVEESEFDLPQGLAIAEKMEEIMNRLAVHESPVVFFDMLASTTRRREVVVFFLALLELIRLQKVEALQSDQYGDIKLTIRMAVEKC